MTQAAGRATQAGARAGLWMRERPDDGSGHWGQPGGGLRLGPSTVTQRPEKNLTTSPNGNDLLGVTPAGRPNEPGESQVPSGLESGARGILCMCQTVDCRPEDTTQAHTKSLIETNAGPDRASRTTKR